MRHHGWINVYRSGFFHRSGKPLTLDRHGGDIYDSWEDAVNDVEPASHYIDTIPISWDDREDVHRNASYSEPIPLSITRRRESV